LTPSIGTDDNANPVAHRQVCALLANEGVAVDAPDTSEWRRTTRPLVIAHRGQSAEVPANTVESFTRAIDLGAEIIEADVQMSRDDHIVMLHGLLEETTEASGVASDLTWDELQRLDAGARSGGRYSGLRIPSLEAVLDLGRDRGVPVCIDVKGPTPADAAAAAVAVAELIRSRGGADRTLLNCFHYEAFPAAREILPDIDVVPDVYSEISVDPDATAELARTLGAPIIMHDASIPEPTVAALHKAGIAVWVWDVMDDESIERSVSQGVDGILGKDVAAVVRVLDRVCPRVEPPRA
jgi:glycerophosphoryl diester phosphodiesterase